MLWLYGGWKVYISGDRGIYEAVNAPPTPRDGSARIRRALHGRTYMSGRSRSSYCDELPAEYSRPQAVGRHLEGCRIGFDAGGSDREGEPP